MDNPNSNAAQQGNSLPPIASLIRHEQIPKLPHFPEHQKEKYIDGIKKLWETIETTSAGSEPYQTAYKKLFEVTLNIKARMNKNRQDAMVLQAANGGQQNGARPTSSGQQGPLPDARLPAQHMQGGSQQPPQGPFSETVVQKVRELGIQAPPHVIGTEGPERAKQWVKDTQNKYAQQLKTLEEAINKLGEIKQILAQRQIQERPLSEQELRGLQTQQAQVEQIQKQSREAVGKFVNSQRALKERQALGKTANSENPAFDPSRPPNAQPVKQEPNQGMGSQPQVSQELLGQPHTVSSALDAARNQPNAGPPSAMSPQNNGQPSRPAMSQPPIPRPQPNQMPNSNAHLPLNINTNSRPPEQQHNSPHVPPSHSSAMPSSTQEPVPLSHQAAMEQARSYSHPSIQQSTPQSASHGHPTHDQRNQRDPQNNHAKMPIPKDLNLQPTQPVAMGPSRPTLTNGPVAMGPMGQPAIQRHPGYVLEGEGERVLSKKKLEELVRQVTGGTGGEGEEGEGLTAEVEETLLQVADDFVDQVIVTACRLAKLRQSSTLELRDLQLILERNYNIRVPGYASDELRTVKKMQPTPGWAQKLSAVQAAKVTGGKGDL
ncbi:MAG: Transcription initiation factor TFIID subunit 12 [Alectoria sarmentosa]|nr:MAG: Transcription initiation factor TFIID subunit 12 [Alectoria sarmentosa]CAD6569393.1 MAG: Transcription initiation factor TFIID subunit 12 [Alectoria sarmentosa]